MARNTLAAAIARPQNFEYRGLERFDGLVDQSGVVREQLLFLVDDGKMPVKATGFPERAPHLAALRQIGEQSAFFGFMAMDLQAEHAEPGIIQTAADNFKRGELLGDK
jgi:hypothetical protein